MLCSPNITVHLMYIAVFRSVAVVKKGSTNAFSSRRELLSLVILGNSPVIANL